MQRLVNRLFFIFIGALLLSILGIYNGYPLYLGDSPNYIHRAINNTLSSHWANFYSIFIETASLGFSSLYYIPFVQNIIICITIFKVYNSICKEDSSFFGFFSLILLLLFSSLPWISNTLMSDIFTSSGILCLAWLFLKDKFVLNLQSVFILLLLACSFIAHQSHALIYPLITLLGFLYDYLFLKGTFKNKLLKLGFILLLFFLSHLVLKPFVHGLITRHGTEISSSEGEQSEKAPIIGTMYMFALSRFNTTGGLAVFLKNNCQTENYYLCEFPTLPNTNQLVHISPIPLKQRTPSNPEYNLHIKDCRTVFFKTLTSPIYWKYYIKTLNPLIKGGVTLSMNYQIRSFNATKWFRTDYFKEKMADDINIFKKSLQYGSLHDKLKYIVETQNHFYNYYLLFSIIFLFILIYYLNTHLVPNSNLIVFSILFIITSILVNHLICGGFSNPHNSRYSTRVNWLFHFVVFSSWLSIILKPKFVQEGS